MGNLEQDKLKLHVLSGIGAAFGAWPILRRDAAPGRGTAMTFDQHGMCVRVLSIAFIILHLFNCMLLDKFLFTRSMQKEEPASVFSCR